MKNKKVSGGAILWAFAAWAAGGLSASAQTVTMNVDDYTSYTSILNSEYIGIYQFNVTAASPAGTVPLGNFWSVCLSPDGNLDPGTSPTANAYTYNYQNFDTAATGLNGPAPWAGSSAGKGGYGIQNAQYLWSVFGSASSALSGTQVPGAAGLTGNAQEQSAGLAAAMYVALYDSTSLGNYDITMAGKYNPVAALNITDSKIVQDMNADLSLLNQPGSATVVGNNLAVGYVLDPVKPAAGGPSGQEFIILASNSGNVAVPEPASSGVIAGAFTLVAVIGGILRKKKA